MKFQRLHLWVSLLKLADTISRCLLVTSDLVSQTYVALLLLVERSLSYADIALGRDTSKQKAISYCHGKNEST